MTLAHVGAVPLEGRRAGGAREPSVSLLSLVPAAGAFWLALRAGVPE